VANYGIPAIENRPRPQLQGGAYRSTGSRNPSDLWAAIRAEEAMGQQASARAAMAAQAQAGLLGSMARRGVQSPQMAQAAQAGGRIRPAATQGNPLLEAMAAQRIQGSMTQANLEMLRQILAQNSPSGMDQAMGVGLPIMGMMAGIPGGFAGMSAGMGMGSGLSGLFNAY